MAQILILGGGFGGLAAAHVLRDSLTDDHEITLVDRESRFFVGFAKLWDMVGTRQLDQGSFPLSKLSQKGIRFIQTEVSAIDPKTKKVQTAQGELKADYLIVALGAAFSEAHTSVLRGNGSHNLYDAHSLPGIRRDLEEIRGGKIVVDILGVPYKCPPAPYEAAFMIDELLRKTGRRASIEMEVYTPQPSPLPIAGPEASKKIASTLEERGIALNPDHKTTSIDPDGKALHFENGSEGKFDLLLGVPAHVAPKVLAESGLLSDSGWIEPDRTTLSTSFEGVYAVGDCTAVMIATGQLPKAGVFAEAEGKVASQNILADIQGSPGAEFDGHGYCFLDWSDGTGSYVQGDFFAHPKPKVEVSSPDEKTLRAKETFERERLEAWS